MLIFLVALASLAPMAALVITPLLMLLFASGAAGIRMNTQKVLQAFAHVESATDVESAKHVEEDTEEDVEEYGKQAPANMTVDGQEKRTRRRRRTGKHVEEDTEEDVYGEG